MQLSATDAMIHEVILVSMLTESFGDCSKCRYRMTLPPLLTKDNNTVQALTLRLIQEYSFQNATRSTTFTYKGRTYVVSSSSIEKEKERSRWKLFVRAVTRLVAGKGACFN